MAELFGIQTFNKNGALEVSINSRLMKILGTIATDQVNGSFTDARLSGGRPFYITATTGYVPIQVYNSGNTVIWNYRDDWVSCLNGKGERSIKDRILYGIY
ncbi:hypothetical protein [Pragia fontium]|uniref:hypothetical protein n=1 Tax=Pragia fontium TaxID=82985 RepID=UPI000649D0A9|nr:hypothetical protein [Pragia fontium]AKJ41484.1 hypothetical protein QQ39_04800 [Pragia fontium]